jgi:3-isopropylmalate/(R)-2-methylmalate dehydratase small subunit
MHPFTTHTGLVAAMDRANVDTDQIIPKQFLKRIERSGYGPFLFYDWRYHDDGKTPRPEFELNRPIAAGASILLARRNFGCGSSREHAVWAIENYGFRVVIAPSFADIFYNNCFKNGVLPIRLTEEQVDDLFHRAAKGGYKLTVDLNTRRITDSQGLSNPNQVEEALRHKPKSRPTSGAAGWPFDLASGRRKPPDSEAPSGDSRPPLAHCIPLAARTGVSLPIARRHRGTHVHCF